MNSAVFGDDGDMQIGFNSSDRSTLGVEVELQIVDRETWGLSSGASKILAAVGGHPKIKHELMESNLELVTGVCETVAEARADLETTLGDLAPVAAGLGLELCCAGTHPFSDWADQCVTSDERYERLVEEMAWPARRLNIFGIHCHVGVRSAEKAISIANAASAYIPHFLALSASSPYWMGKDTGLASIRSKVFEALPTAGLPHQMADWSEFEAFMTTLIRAGSI
ncbi:MAG TPA: YbdK family carboxylate-amine ligase, partial [Acidimicrobiia bacterium]